MVRRMMARRPSPQSLRPLNTSLAASCGDHNLPWLLAAAASDEAGSAPAAARPLPSPMVQKYESDTAQALLDAVGTRLKRPARTLFLTHLCPHLPRQSGPLLPGQAQLTRSARPRSPHRAGGKLLSVADCVSAALMLLADGTNAGKCYYLEPDSSGYWRAPKPHNPESSGPEIEIVIISEKSLKFKAAVESCRRPPAH